MNGEKPGQDRRRRPLPWLLLFLAGLLMAELGAGIGWFATHGSAGKVHATGSGAGYGVDRAGRRDGSGTGTGSGVASNTGTGQTPTVARDTTQSTTVRDAVVETSTTANLRGLTVSTAVLGQLAPGVATPLVITIRNAGASGVRVTYVQVTPGQSPVAGCRTGWYAVTGQVPAALVVPGRGSATLTWHLLLRDLPHRNQDVCKGARIPFRVRVEAVEAPA